MNRLIIALLVFLPSVLLAQNFQGMAVYESKRSLKELKIESKDLNDDMMKKIMDGMKKQYEKTYILNFNKYESVYQEEQKLETPSSGFSMGFMSSSANEVTYKNIKNKVQLAEQEFLGKEFLVTDSLKVYNWELQSETKKIGDYTCYKAISVDRVTQEDLDQYEAEKIKQDTANTAFFTITEPKERIVTVWYTPEIPVSQGPGAFWGLPGLIMEASFDDTIILCSKIVLNPTKKLKIKAPRKGKEVTKSQYDSLIEKQMEKMTNQNGVILIEIGQ
ncbi:GLPGLI family protein [Flavobacterium tegetincola]|uniref:GLPGLI family protein n=1 Tax=Flavobacterium tegetincola TaxID=150172 RepID=UPI000411D1C6|nr:GLPGLI family protein [Flavobacterium tegetincola]